MLRRSLRTDIIFALILLLSGIHLTGWKNIANSIINNFSAAFFPLLSITCFFLIIFYLIGRKRKPGFLFSLHFWLTLLFYPAWALIQQLIVLLWVYFPVLKLTDSVLMAVITGASFFAALHLPNINFFLTTLFGELIFLTAFSQTGNILAIVLCHSLIAPTYYFWVCGDDVLRRRLSGK